MLLATLNVNSIRARKDRFLSWLSHTSPDIVCLQEIKCVEGEFPFRDLDEIGYEAHAYGQKTYNGVAILSRESATDLRRGFDDGQEEDPQARIIAATIEGVRVVSVYVPNGSEVGSDKWHYKLSWLTRFEAYLQRELASGLPLAVCGDFNIITDERDLNFPEKWEGSVLTVPEIVARLHGLLGLGLHDTLRKHHPEAGLYSWWDYRSLGFPRNDGLRIDYVLVTPPLLERCSKAWIDREERKGDKASDHAPVLAEFEG